MSTRSILIRLAQKIFPRSRSVTRPIAVLRPPMVSVGASGNTLSTRSSEELRIQYFLDYFWCDKYGMFFQGWILCFDHLVRRFVITIGEDSHEVTHFTPRMDLLNFYPGQSGAATAGFSEFVPARAGEKVFFTVDTDRGSRTIPVELPKFTLPDQRKGRAGMPEEFWEAFSLFTDEVNTQHLTVLQIGSRVVTPEGEDFRRFFPHANRYLGMDIYPSPAVDVVGDAHFLSKAIGMSSVDAVFSVNVLEHLPYPWLLAKEINLTLRVGGLVFHCAPQTWPLHEQPNDFWRFSDEGLKTLFGPNTGFDIIQVKMIQPTYMYPEYRMGAMALHPLHVGFGFAMILARKVRDIDPGAIVWPVSMGDSQDRSQRYPARPPSMRSGPEVSEKDPQT